MVILVVMRQADPVEMGLPLGNGFSDTASQGEAKGLF